MAPKFRVPKCLEDLMELPNGDEDMLYAQDIVDVDSLDASEMHRLVAGVVSELANKEVLCVQEQSVFDQLYSLVRGYTYLEVSQKSILLDSLCSNFVQLNVSTSILINSIDDPNEDTEDVTLQSWAHCNAIKIYAYFLSCILIAEEADLESSARKSSGKSGKSKGRPRKKHVPEDWDWSSLRGRSLRVLAGALQNDLKKIFESSQLDETFIAFLAKAAFKMFENKSLLAKGDCKQPLCTIISACSIQYGYGISSVATIIEMLHKFEHLPAHMADLVSLAENQHTRSSLAVDLLRSIGKISPENFERDTAGADNVGEFLQELAVRLPKIMMTNLSLFLCHLDGKSYKMRNSLVIVIGKLLGEATKKEDATSTSDVIRLGNEQRLLNILVERSRDISAHTRKHVLQTWAYLCKERAVPIGHWNLVSDLAAGRLEDNAAIVRKNALQLLATLLEYNPFGDSLRAAAFEATHEKYSEKLSGMSPRNDNTVGEGEEAGQNLQDMELDFSAEHENEAGLESSEGAPSTPGGNEESSQPETVTPQAQQPAAPDPQFSNEIGGLEHTRALVASLESALRFSKCIGSTMDTLSQLLASSTIGDVESTIQLLIICKKFEVDGSGHCLRKTLPLVFSHEEGIKSAVEEAFTTLYLKGTPSEMASNLINLTVEACLGDLASIEELVSESMSNRTISAGTVSALWDFFTFNAPGSTAEQSRAALTVLCMAAKSTPQILSTHLQNILDIGFGRWAKDDVLLARSACIALQRLPVKDRAVFRGGHKLFSTLSNLIVGRGLSEACWYSASEQAINAIYALHPAPESFSSGLLVKLAQSIFTRSQRSASPDLSTDDGDIGQQSYDFSSVSAIAASRFLFAVAHVSLKHLVYIESCLKLVRKQRNDEDKVAANRAAEESIADVGIASSKDESIAAELGLAASEDAKLDDLGAQAETELISGHKTQTFLVGAIAPMVSSLCSNSILMQQNQHLRSSALLALCKLMVIDANFCDKHLQLLFTIAQNSLEDSVRSNCVVALGDLALRFPNLVEPWMESMYARVHDKSTAVRKNTVLVLSHLILNDLIKVKGYISGMAMHLEDEDSRISDLVKLFFHELSKKGNNPINNLLPDILSRLSSNPALTQDQFNLIMQFLIGTIKKSKQMEGLVEKFCTRFEGISNRRQWQDIAFCLSQLSYPQSCLRKLADNFKLYQHALGDTEVLAHFKALIGKTRKLASADVKLLLDEIEEKIMKCHEEKKEQEQAMQKAQEHNLRRKELEEALLAQSLDELNLGTPASDGDELETQTADEGSVAIPQEREAIGVETIVTVKPEPVEQNAAIGIQNNDIEGHNDPRTGIDATTSMSDDAEHAVDSGVAVDEIGNRGAHDVVEDVVYANSSRVHQADSTISGEAQDVVEDVGYEDSRQVHHANSTISKEAQDAVEYEDSTQVHQADSAISEEAQDVVEDVEYEDSRNVHQADSTIYEGQSQLLSQGFSALRITEINSLEEDTSGTQPYPYMDVDLESAKTQDPPASESRADAVRVKQERDLENDESQYNAKENPFTGPFGRDDNQMPSSPFIPAPPSLESPEAARTSRRRRLRKVGAKSEKTQNERSPRHERISGQSRVLRPHNETS
ncbi:unnamed protein product [Calypogeia fissa]